MATRGMQFLWLLCAAAAWAPASRSHAPRAVAHRAVADPPAPRGALKASEVARLNPVSLAYLGDAVLELFLREHFIWPPRRPAELRAIVVELVRAETQAAIVRELVGASADGEAADAAFALTDEEREWLKRGRNATKGRGPSRLRGSTYEDASGLECLVGFLHLTDAARLDLLLREILRLNPEPADEKGGA